MKVDLRGLAKNIRRAMGKHDTHGWGFALDMLVERHEELEGLLNEMTDSEPCRYDYHGYCQTHYLHENPCPHERAKKLLGKAATNGK